MDPTSAPSGSLVETPRPGGSARSRRIRAALDVRSRNAWAASSLVELFIDMDLQSLHADILLSMYHVLDRLQRSRISEREPGP